MHRATAVDVRIPGTARRRTHAVRAAPDQQPPGCEAPAGDMSSSIDQANITLTALTHRLTPEHEQPGYAWSEATALAKGDVAQLPRQQLEAALVLAVLRIISIDPHLNQAGHCSMQRIAAEVDYWRSVKDRITP